MGKIPNPFKLIICSYEGMIKKYIWKAKKTWKAYFIQDHFVDSDFYEDPEIVFLTPSANEVITDIDPDKTYVLGGEIPKVVETFKAPYTF